MPIDFSNRAYSIRDTRNNYYFRIKIIESWRTGWCSMVFLLSYRSVVRTVLCGLQYHPHSKRKKGSCGIWKFRVGLKRVEWVNTIVWFVGRHYGSIVERLIWLNSIGAECCYYFLLPLLLSLVVFYLRWSREKEGEDDDDDGHDTHTERYSRRREVQNQQGNNLFRNERI